jgi:protease-4
MKQFFTAIAANLVTVALVVVGGILLFLAIAATAGRRAGPAVRAGSILVVDLAESLVDAPAELAGRAPWEDAFLSGGVQELPLRSALLALREAATDDRIRGVLLRGTVASSGYGSGYAALREFRDALADFRRSSGKPVHAYLVNPDTRDYYVASAAGTITLDPFGALLMPGLVAEQLYLAGLFEKLGIGVQVSRVGRFKAAVEPFTRSDMSVESRQQLQQYLGTMWTEVKRAVGESRGIDTVALQALVDTRGILLAEEARAERLVDRVAYFDAVLDDLEAISAGRSPDSGRVLEPSADAPDSAATPTADTSGRVVARADRATVVTATGDQPRLPQVTLREYARIAHARSMVIGASQAVAIVYAEGDIVSGEGGSGVVPGDALARELRRLRTDDKVKAVVLRVNSPGGSALASETILRELSLLKATRPVVVSMGSLAASGGYWISTAASRVYAHPNTITGSIGVFSLIPNLKGLANRNGVTFDTVKTGRYADLFTLARPRTAGELEVLQRMTDAVYDAFLERVARARALPIDSVRAIAEGRVWSGADAMRIGLVDSIGGLADAVRGAAALAGLTGDYEVRELPRRKGAAEQLGELFDRKAPPVAATLDAARSARLDALLPGSAPGRALVRDLLRDLDVLLAYDDPRATYARLPFVLRLQ